MLTWTSELIQNIVEPFTHCVIGNDFGSRGDLFSKNVEFWIPNIDGEGSYGQFGLEDIRQLCGHWAKNLKGTSLTLQSVELYEDYALRTFRANYHMTTGVSTLESAKFLEGINFDAQFSDNVTVGSDGKIFMVHRDANSVEVELGNPDFLWSFLS